MGGGILKFFLLRFLDVHNLSFLLYAGLAAVLWGGRKNGVTGALFRRLPFVFLSLETGYLFFYVFAQRIRLFPALTDFLCTAGYFVLILLPKLMKRGDRKC